jgi:5-methyltetrahydropteroyltriglutamate--homocysteine methyltransferase
MQAVQDQSSVAQLARADHVGSLLRPPELLEARESGVGLKAAEDAAIREAVARQEQAGLPVVTDGEFRRESFQSELTAAVDGFEGVSIDAWLWGDWHSDELGDKHVERPAQMAVTRPLEQRRALAAEEFTFLRAITGRVAKVTLPSPSLFANLWDRERSREAYPRFDDFMAAVTELLVREVRELERLGCRYVQLDAPHYPLLVDPTWRAFYEARGWSAESWIAYGLELDNAVIDAAPGVTFGFHLCRGNQDSRWLVAGGYDRIAGPIFKGVHASRLLLEYDDERSGGFEPLREVPDDKLVVLGLVTTKSARLEDGAELERRIHDAAAHTGLERLALGTQCGFATSIVGNALGSEDQFAKLALIAQTAQRVWD